MLESRRSYGWSGYTGELDQKSIVKYKVTYTDKDGGYHELDHTFSSHRAALAYAESLLKKEGIVSSSVSKVRKTYSNY